MKPLADPGQQIVLSTANEGKMPHGPLQPDQRENCSLITVLTVASDQDIWCYQLLQTTDNCQCFRLKIVATFDGDKSVLPGSKEKQLPKRKQ